MSDFIPNRVNSGKAGAGQFDFKRNSEADLDLVEDSVSSENQVFTDAYEALSTNAVPTDLVYIEQGDSLTEDQIEMALKGDWDNLNEDIDEYVRDQRYSAARELAEEEINGLVAQGRFHTEWEDLDEEDQDRAIDAVIERDTSDPATDLLKGTPDQNLRLPVQDLTNIRRSYDENIRSAIDSMDADIDDVLGDDPDGKHTQDRIKLLEGILKKNGVEVGFESMDASLRSFVDQGYENWNDASIDIVWKGSVSEVTPSTAENSADVAGREISVNGPQLVMSFDDHTESSGHSIPANFKTAIGGGNHATIDPNPYDYSRNWTTAETTGWRFYNRPPESV